MAPKLPITGIDSSIATAQYFISRFPRSHAEHIIGVHTLAMAQFARYKLSQEKEDLDKSIVHYAEAILLPHISPIGPYHSVVKLLSDLAWALLVRFKRFERYEDLEYCIEYLRYLRGLPLGSVDAPRKTLTTPLLWALLTKIESGAGDGIRNIEEMLVLCRELLTSDISADFPFYAFKGLSRAFNAESIRGRPIQLLDEVIECLRDAAKVCPPGSCEVLFALAHQLYARFVETHSHDNYEEATALLEKILDPEQSGECTASTRAQASSLAALLVITRSAIFGNPEYSEAAISRLRAELSSPSIDEGLRLQITHILASLARGRFERYSLDESLQEANSYTSQLTDLSSFQSLEKSGIVLSEAVREGHSMASVQQQIEHLEESLSNTLPGTSHHKLCLGELAKWYETKFSRTNDISDIEESLKYRRQSLDATHPSDPWRINSLVPLRDTLRLAFEKTSKIKYLDAAIILGYDILKLKSAQHGHFNAIQWLVVSLLTRLQLVDRTEDLDDAIRLMSLAVDDPYAREPDRFVLACGWALFAQRTSHSSLLTAYKNAMSLMQKSLSFSPTLSIQHTRLVAMGENCRRMPLDYASHQIDSGRIEEAIETLEQGRALLWSEMRGFRTTVAQLNEEDSVLEKRLSEINQELEALTISVTPSAMLQMKDGVAQSGDWTDPFGRLVVRQRKLVQERDALILKIQGRPGLEGFLKTPSFTTLRSAASRGPVILINHCEWRSDILILVHNSPPCFISTANDFYDRANQLRDELVEARKHGLDSGEYQDALCSVLKGLYHLVGGPVIKRLRELGVPEQSRIWWCPNSVFCSLPLHAMGPVPSSDTCIRYFSDLYIPSYTPSLSALIESRKASPQILEKPSLLLVAQPDDSLPGVNGEIKVIRKLEERVTVTGLVSSKATPTSVVEGLRGSRLAHFACHGVLETGKPFEASFKLHGVSRLTLLDIVRSRLPNAEFAFLSCCHAAEITEESIAEEALHLAAAMQYCGFRSVVGTLWEMADTDGRDLARSFYKSLFSSEKASVPYFERSAEALRDATQKLRKKRGITLERWVNFVHYGA